MHAVLDACTHAAKDHGTYLHNQLLIGHPT